MSCTESVTQGNMFKLIVALTADGAALSPGLASATNVRVKLEKANKGDSLSSDDASPLVTLDDPVTDSVSWQLSSSQTAALDPGVYDLAIEVQYSPTNILEWKITSAISIVKGLI